MNAYYKVNESVWLDVEGYEGFYQVLEVKPEGGFIKGGYLSGDKYHYRLDIKGPNNHNWWLQRQLKKDYADEFDVEYPPMTFDEVIASAKKAKVGDM